MDESEFRYKDDRKASALNPADAATPEFISRLKEVREIETGQDMTGRTS